MKRRMVALLCAAAMFVGWIPTDVFAAENQMTMGFDLVNTSGHEVLMPGDEISVDIWVADAGWTDGFNGAVFGIEYDTDILQAKQGSGTLNETFKAMDGIYEISLADMQAGVLSAAYMPGINQYYVENCTGKLTDEKMSLLTYTLVVKDPLPADRVEDLQLECFVSSFSVGTDTITDDHMLEMVGNDAFNIVTNYDLKLDTRAPAITVGDGTTADFAYTPVQITVAGDNGDVASVKLDDTELTADENGSYWAEHSGMITATDRYGNTASQQISIQADAFLAAKEAAAQIPAAEDVLYTDRDSIARAQQALDDVADETARQKLAVEQEKVTQAQQAWDAIEQNVGVVNDKIRALAALPEDAPLSELLAALKEIDDLLNNADTGLFTTKGVQESDLENYAAYRDKQEASAQILEQIRNLQQQINDLPDREQITLADTEAVEKLEQAVSSVEALYGEGLFDKTRLEDARARLEELNQERDEAIRQVKEQIAALPAQDAVGKADEEAIRAARQALEELQKTYQDEEILSAQEMERLVQAEQALQALEAEVQALQQAIDALYGDSAEEVLYTQKDDITALQQRVEALAGKGYSVDTDKLDRAAEQIELLETERQAVADAIAALPDPTDFAPSNENIQAVSKIQTRLTALEERGVDLSTVEGYDKYTAICEKLAQALQEIEAVKEKIAALPVADKVRFDTDTESVRAAVTALQETYGAQILEESELKPLTDAEARKAELKTQRETLVRELKNFAPEIGLSDEHLAVIEQMRQRVSDLEALGTTFSAEELANLTRAEQELADLQQESKQAHADIAALYAQDASEIRYPQKQAIQQLQQTVTRLKECGDTSFTEEEMEKLQNAVDAIADMDARKEALTEKIRALPQDTVRYADKAEVTELQKEMEALETLGNPVDQAEETLFDNFLALLDAMEEQIRAVNDEMAEALKNWTFGGEQAPFDAIRQKMDVLAEKYQISEEQKPEVFPQYNTSVDKQQQAEALLQKVSEAIDALPGKVELKHENAVNAIGNQLQQLRKEYGIGDDTLQKELFNEENEEDRFAKYQAAAKRIEELKKQAEEESQQTGTNNAQNSSNTQNGNNSGSTAQQTAQAAPQQAATVTVPQTSDLAPLEAYALTAALALAGFVFALMKKRHEK